MNQSVAAAVDFTAVSDCEGAAVLRRLLLLLLRFIARATRTVALRAAYKTTPTLRTLSVVDAKSYILEEEFGLNDYHAANNSSE